MADTVIDLIQPGSSLNLGIGMPTMIIERMPPEKRVMIHSENGVLGVDWSTWTGYGLAHLDQCR